jgi:hypothetical protein
VDWIELAEDVPVTRLVKTATNLLVFTSSIEQLSAVQ